MLRWFLMLAVVLSAAGMQVSDNSALLEEQYEASGADEAADAIPDYALDYLDRLGIEPDAYGQESVDVFETADVLMELAAEKARLPFSACFSAFGIIVLCGLCGHTAAGSDSPGKSFETVSSAAASLAVCIPLGAFIDSIADGITGVCRFGAVLIPVLSGLAAANGSTASAAAGSAVTLAALEGITVLMPAVLVPALRVLLGISAVSSLCDFFDTGRIISAVDKALKWTLGGAGVFLSGVLGISTVAASAADGAAARTARFVLSGAVPIVGGVIGEALGTISNCVGIIRGSVGAFGIIAGLFIVLPAAFLACGWLAGLNVTAWAADALGSQRTAAALRAMSAVVSAALGLTAFAAMTVLCSAAVITSLRSV